MARIQRVRTPAAAASREPQVLDPDTLTPATSPEEVPGTPRSKLPKPSQWTLLPEDFCAYTAALTDADWAHTIIYVYRTWPVMQHPPEVIRNIDKLSAPLTLDYLLQEHGSGKYKICLNDADFPNKTVCRTFPALNDPDCPPRLNLAYLNIGHPDNRSYVESLKRSGILTTEGKLVEQVKGEGDSTSVKELAGLLREAFTHLLRQQQSSTAPGMEGKVVEHVMEMMDKASTRSLEMALGQVKQSEPEQFLKLLAVVKDVLAPAQNNASDRLLETVLKMQQDTQRQLAESQARREELMLKLVERREPADAGIGKLKELAEFLDLMRGEGAGGRRLSTLETIAPLVPQALEHIRGIVHDGISLARRGPTGETATVLPAPAAPGGPGAAVNPANQEVDATVAQFAHFVPALAGPLLQALSVGKNGEEFAEDLSEFLGPVAYQQLRSLGEERLLALLRTHPPLWAQLAPMEQQVRTFIEEFVRWQAEPPEKEPEEASGKKRKAVVQ